MIDFIWIIPLLPLAGAAVNGLLGKRLPKAVISLVACGTSGMAFLIAIGAVMDLLGRAPDERHILRTFYTWIASGDFVARAEFLLDPLSAVMLLVVTGVGFVIHIYSIGYMHAENGYYRFFAYMNLFLFSMLILILSGNFLLMFVGWEGVGLCSYLLIGYYFEKRSAGDAGKKAFIVNRIGDVGFVLGIFLIFATFNSLDFAEVFRQIATETHRFPVESGVGILTAIGLLLFVGATGKSAQLPLYVWLPDAMEGPTPVSALIHAATMVTAGVYMVVRCSPIFSRAPIALAVVAAIGIVTALFAATIGLVQSDIKRVLAYSTVSQLGYMFAAAGVGAFSAGIFHLMTHAFFKALLFLGAGSVIHALGGEQDLTRMGGMRKYIPVTHATMFTAALAISGIFPLAGFFSKDEILWSAWAHGHPIVWLVGLITAGMTAFYMFRLMFLAFHGQERFSDEARHHLHESPPSMTMPLILLAVLSIVGGLVGLPAWLNLGSNRFFKFMEPSLALAYQPEHEELSHGLELGFAGISVLVAIIGIWIAYGIYVKRPQSAEALATRTKGLYRLLLRKYYVDELYDRVFVNPTVTGSRETLWKGIDMQIIDGTVNGVGRAIMASAGLLKGVQNGHVRSYAAWIFLGAVAVLFGLLMLR
ncbi:MAG TPA: NADH-quinone oxidoreductase subunit L [Acidobacteriota bacterium]|nr:NADH-quinone oxidoreductase subunit L [Acidobacteriota bacterium]